MIQNLMKTNGMQSAATELKPARKAMVRYLVLAGAVAILLEPSMAAAGAGGGGGVTSLIDQTANTILGWMNGTLSRSLAVIAIMVLGIMAMFGKLAWETAIKVVIGVVLVFGAASIVNLIATNNSGGTTVQQLSN